LKTSPDGVDFIEYLSDEIQENVFHAILTKLYQKFVLLNEKITTMYKVRGMSCLRDRLKKHFDLVRIINYCFSYNLLDWLARISDYMIASLVFALQSLEKIDASKSGITDIFRGLQFFPLDREMFLTSQCFINRLHLTFPQIGSLLLLQGERLIW